jgi:hypothetical protein
MPPPLPPPPPRQNPPHPPHESGEREASTPPTNSSHSSFATPRNPFGVYKQYHYLDPQYIDPEGFIDGADLVEANIAAVVEKRSEGLNKALLDTLLPSPCALRLAEWYWQEGADKSRRSFQSLVDIVSSDEFKADDIKNTNWRKVYALLGLTVEESEALNGSESEELGSWFTETSWKRKDVPINVPFDSDTEIPGTHRYVIKDFFYRPLMDVIHEKLSSFETQEHFHLLPYELRWKATADSPGVRLHGEIYTSPAFAKAHKELQVRLLRIWTSSFLNALLLQDSPPEPGCTRSRHIIAIMFASDKAQLATFGTAAIWPLYFFCGNESKYDRCRPSLKMGEQVAYFEEVSNLSLEGTRTS